MFGILFFLGQAVLLEGSCSGSSSHSMRYCFTSASAPGQQVHRFSYVCCMDYQEFVFYNRKVLWIRKVEKNDTHYWKRRIDFAQGHERSFQDHLSTLAKYSNQSGGSSSHSMRYCFTSALEPGQQVHRFSYVGCVDYQEFVFYNRKVPWIRKVEKNNKHYRKRSIDFAQGHERSFQDHLSTLAKYSNQSGGSLSHSMRYFITSASEPGQQVPQFSYVGYVDDQEFVFYNTSTKRYLPKVPWIRKVEKDDPDYWKRNSNFAQGHERSFQDHMVTLARYYNQSGGVHTFQLMYGCELRRDGSKGGYYQYAYDGKDYISLDKETLTWTAAEVPAQITKRKWDADSEGNQFKKFYLEETCIKWLQRYLGYGKEMLLRTEAPKVKVTRKVDYDGMETLICRAGGFYPKEIDITWTRDGEDRRQDTLHGLVSPNCDGTYYTWRSITVDPKERERYKCHVEHNGLPNPVDVAWEEPGFRLRLVIMFPAVTLVLVMAAVFMFAVYFKKRQDGYKAAAGIAKSHPGPTKQHNSCHEREDKKSSSQDVIFGFHFT